MGEELQNENLVQQEPEQQQEQQESVKTEQEIEGSAVKILRNKLENLIKENKELKERLSKFEELASVSDLESLVAKLNRLELENKIAKEYPELSDEVEEILKIRKPGESVEDTIVKYIGLKELEARKSRISPRSNLGVIPTSETDLSKLPPQEREQIARKYFEQLYGGG